MEQQQNKAQQELKRIEEEIKTHPPEFSGHNTDHTINGERVRCKCDLLEAKKQGILLGLEAGKQEALLQLGKPMQEQFKAVADKARKEVFDFIDKHKNNQGSHFMFDEEDYQRFKEELVEKAVWDTLGEKE